MAMVSYALMRRVRSRLGMPSIACSARLPCGFRTRCVLRIWSGELAAMYTTKRKRLPYWIHEHELDDTRRRVAERVSEPPPAA